MHEKDTSQTQHHAATSEATLDTLHRLWSGIASLLPDGQGRTDIMLRLARALLEEGARPGAVTLRVHVDALTEDRLAAKLPEIRAQVRDATPAYARRGAVKVGLNRLCALGRQYTAHSFAPKAAEEVGEVEVELEADDALRATALAVGLGVELDQVIGAALCTGLAMLCGVNTRIEGPFAG